MNIITDLDHNLDYETNNISRKIFNLFFIPFLNLLPSRSSVLIKNSHKSVSEVLDNATTHKALEVLYKKGHKHHTNNFIQKLSHSVWFNIGNSKAVRNRLKIVKRELTKILIKLKEKKQNINIASIASGSARAVIEAINEAKIPEEIKISVTFVDKDPGALKYSEQLLKDYGLQNRSKNEYKWVNTTVGSFIKEINNDSFDIIEMVGLLDYFNDEKAIDTFKYIKYILKKDGVFITANVCPNPEQKFITNTIDWKMIYRSAEELGKLLIESGFSESYIKIYYEPLEIHCVAVAIRE